MLGFEWTGEYEDVEITEYWCPAARFWSWCRECTDGTPHAPERQRMHHCRKMRATQ